jgi:pantothenate kinase
MKRREAIFQVAELIAAIHLDHPVRVGIDGVDCEGKTMLADELVKPLQARGREVIRASIDGFHNPREIRHRQGRSSPRGYYEDSFDADNQTNSLQAHQPPQVNPRLARLDLRVTHAVIVLEVLSGIQWMGDCL